MQGVVAPKANFVIVAQRESSELIKGETDKKWPVEIIELSKEWLEPIYKLTIEPLIKVSLEELEEKFKLLAPLYAYFQGALHLTLSEQKTQEELLQAESSLMSLSQEEIKRCCEVLEISSEDFCFGFAKLIETDKFAMEVLSKKLPEKVEEMLPSFLSFHKCLSYALIAGIMSLWDENACIDNITWLSRRTRDYAELVEGYLSTFEFLVTENEV